MHALGVLGDPVRRRILELLAGGEMTSGAVCGIIRDEFAIVRPDGARRLYDVKHEPLRDVDAWLERFRHNWTQHLDAAGTELARGKRERLLREERPLRGGGGGDRSPSRS